MGMSYYAIRYFSNSASLASKSSPRRPEATIQPNEENLDLTLAVMNLPIKFREAIILYYYQDMNTVEISNVLGITQSSVSNRLKRGRELLSKALGGRDFDE